MYFDLRNCDSGLDRLDGADLLATSVVSADEGLAFGDEFRRKEEGTHCEILSVPSDHCLCDLGDLNEEGVFRLFFLAQFRLLRRRSDLSRLRSSFRGLSPGLCHHECPERWCSLVEGPLSNSSNDALSHSRSATRR
jgi:hypothetical protein